LWRAFDDENAKKGYCLYKVGCKGPTTYNACSVMRNGTPAQAIPSNRDTAASAAREENYWDAGAAVSPAAQPFPGFGIESGCRQDRHGAAIATVWVLPRTP
jgi:hydrogenase small subunit